MASNGQFNTWIRICVTDILLCLVCRMKEKYFNG